MTLKSQFQTVKNNWLLFLVGIMVILLLFGATPSIQPLIGGDFEGYGEALKYDAGAPSANIAGDAAIARSGIIRPTYGGFAPDVSERKITTTASVSSEVKRGEFDRSEQELKNIISSSNSFLLNENRNTYERGVREYTSGSYAIKVETSKYNSIIEQLKHIGELQSFNENTDDITEQYTNTEINLALERERLARYRTLYNEAVDINDKLQLNDRIFDQERTVKYLEESLTHQDQRVQYSSIYFTMTEERSDYYDITVIKFKDMIRELASSFNNVVSLIFTLIPWIIVIALVWFIVRFARKHQRP